MAIVSSTTPRPAPRCPPVTETAETKRLYPFDFALNVTHRLCADGFETRFTVENHTGRDMPFLIGGHPAFAGPLYRVSVRRSSGEDPQDSTGVVHTADEAGRSFYL